jgi:hypothetical protein
MTYVLSPIVGFVSHMALIAVSIFAVRSALLNGISFGISVASDA